MIITCIDIGANSVRALVANTSGIEISPIFVDSKCTRLSEGLVESNRLSETAIARTFEATETFVIAGRDLGSEKFRIFTTFPGRNTDNLVPLMSLIRERLGLTLEIFSGDREAELIYRGIPDDLKNGYLKNEEEYADAEGAQEGIAVGTMPDCDIGTPPENEMQTRSEPVSRPVMAAFDIGGGATWFILRMPDGTLQSMSINIGSVKLMEEYPDLKNKCGDEKLIEAKIYIRTALEHALPVPGNGGHAPYVIGLGGSVVTAAGITSKRGTGSRDEIHGTSLTLLTAESLVDMSRGLNCAERAKEFNLEPRRADVLVAGTLILIETLRFFGASELTVSTMGILHGVAKETTT